MTEEELEEYMEFIPYEIYKGSSQEDQIWFFEQNGLWLVKKTDPSSELRKQAKNPLYLGNYKGLPCFCGRLDEGTALPDGFTFEPFRHEGWSSYRKIFQILTKADHLLRWDRGSRYCGKCGAKTKMNEEHRAKECTACGRIEFPRISPAIIVAVTKGDEILLAHNKSFAEKRYSVIAGFVEQGETLEDCVKREVYEEVGVRVNNIRYFKSQPWPGGDSLMFGFFANYESGEINEDGVEIDDAGWFTKDTLPNRPSGISIAGVLINEFINGKR